MGDALNFSALGPEAGNERAVTKALLRNVVHQSPHSISFFPECTQGGISDSR